MKKRYVPDLIQSGNICEQNYLRLLAILGTDNPLSTQIIQIDERSHLQFTLLEQAPFTRTLSISQTHAKKLMDFEIKARLYDDVKLAEVISYQQQKCTRGNYPYPNKKMHHADEKLQANLLLQDCLLLCLKFGHTAMLLPKHHYN